MGLSRYQTVLSSTAGMRGVSTMHFWSGGTPDTDAELDAIATAVNAFWNTVKGRLATSVSYAGEASIDKLDITSGDIIGVKSVTGGSGTGTDVADPLPWHTQGLITWHSGLYSGGRELVGKTFIPGMTEAASTQGVMLTAFAITLETAATTLMNNSSLAVYSRTKHTAGEVGSRVVPLRWSVLRSRRP